ncbi:MAG TPA: hypothetical protein VGP72_23695 [Planctomycetota bacterium]|jgi:hypothetical protein
MPRSHAFFFALVIGTAALLARSADEPVPVGVSIAYQLPADGPLPKSYLVTLAIVAKDNPDWIVSQFVRGAARTVTADNQGKFTDTWDGLDENLMPVPPGTYGVKGICMPAEKWQVDSEYHAITPQFVGGASSWMPSREQWNVPEPFGGDPCGAPLGDVDVGPNGIAVFYYVYLENGTNNPLMDLKKPTGMGQFLRAFNSGGAGGGTSTCTDGETIWSFSTDGGKKYVYRADGKPFGTGRANRANVYLPAGWVKAMACWRDGAKSFVYVAQGGKILETKEWPHFAESDQERVDAITVHEGATGKVLAEIPLPRPIGIAARGSILYAVHASAGRDAGATGAFEVATKTIKAGLPDGEWQRLFAVPAGVKPADIEVDSHGRVYLSDTAANKVYQFDRTGKQLLSYGRLDAQKPGAYDPQTLMAPGKLATWTTAEGEDRLIIVEHAGPNRASEWSADGKLLREFTSLQTKANDGYAVDPEHPEQIYIGGQEGWLTRFRVDFAKGTWTVDAVWPNVGNDPKAPHFDHPQLIRANGNCYLACGRSNNVYRLAGDRWLFSAAIIREKSGKEMKHYAWHDANSDGIVQEEEYRNTPLEMPGWLLRYHGNQWLDDLSLVALNQGGRDVWRLAPASFDAHGNPVFTAWQKLLTDSVFVARAEGKADAIHGGNELAESYSSDWAMVDGSMKDGFYVVARGGHSFSANEGAQIKVTRYVPDGNGGYKMKWRTGRVALQGVAQPGEMYGAIHIWKPLNGLLSVVDQSRCGVLLFTEDGLYVDTIFPDGRRHSHAVAGVYPQPGEFFAGSVFADPASGAIRFAMGKVTPLLYEAQGWSLKRNPVQTIKGLPAQVELTAAQIASPPEIALTLRGGAGAAKVARFSPALGGAVLDGSMTGWESCEPVRFQADKEQTVEVRGLYDPGNLFLRWHVRLASKLQVRPMQNPERIFSHDRLADTMSFCIQGDTNAKPGGPSSGRPGDARFVFSLVQDGAAVKPVVVGMYPEWKGAGKASPARYQTPVNKVEFAHVAMIPDITLAHTLDADGKGFVIAAGIPRTFVPGLPALGNGVRTMGNFEVTYGGHGKFWWSNADGSANRETYDEPSEARLCPSAWAPLQFQGLDSGVVVRHWQICGPFGGPGAEKFKEDLNGPMPGTSKDMKTAGRDFCEAAKYPPDNGVIDLKATFSGEMVEGYWHKPGAVRWTKATVEDLDTRVMCGASAQVYYGATWVHVAQDLALEFRFQGHPQTHLRWFLNGEKVFDGEIKGELKSAFASKTLTLKKGWNQVLFRGYCVGYPKFRTGLVFAGPPEKLWQLRLSATPPAN